MTTAFIKEIQPFLFGRPVTYVDVGAHKGKVFQNLRNAKGITLREAHLIEPNPKSFEILQTAANESTNIHLVRLYNVALGSEGGRVSMIDADTMSRVLQSDQDETRAKTAQGATFDVDQTTLTEVASNVLDQHISILKIDAEGSELRILDGATPLLERDAVDIIYIEAGIDRDNQQQCYYRDIEDFLQKHNYKLFKIYEQKNQWTEDSPILRRVNLAFFSETFAARNPYRLSKSYFAAMQEKEALESKVAWLRSSIETSEAEREEIKAQAAATKTDYEALKVDLENKSDALTVEREALALLKDDLHALEGRLEESRSEASRAVQAMAELEDRHAALTTELELRVEALQAELARTTTEAAERQRELQTLQKERKELALAQKTDRGKAIWLQEASIFMVGALRAARHEHAQALRAQKQRIESQFAYRLGAELTSTRSFAAVLSLPRRLAEQRKSFLAERGASASSSIVIEGLRIGPRMITHTPIFQRVTLQSERAVFVCGHALAAHPRQLEQLSVHVQYRDRNGAVVPATEHFPTNISVDEEGEFRLVLPPLKTASSVDIAFMAGKGDTLFLNISRLERPRPEVAAKWLASASAAPTPVRTAVPAEPTRPSSPGGKKGPHAAQARALDIKMWGGYSRIALPELTTLRDDEDAPRHERSAAAWNLARWWYAEGDFGTALENLDIWRALRGEENKERLVTRVLCLLRLQRFEEAMIEIEAAIERFGRLPDLLFLASSAGRGLRLDQGGDNAAREAEHVQLELINEILIEAGAAPIRLANPDRPLTLDNLATAPCAYEGEQPLKVSIVMPAYSAAGTITTAINSLLAQTWTNLEVVVVDDCSPDDTSAVVAAIAERDPRVKLIRSEKNQGAYPSRNIALEHATGDLFMVHDSDDWSHPQKVERQVRFLMENPQTKACMSHWLRVTEPLEVVGPWLPKPSIFDLNFSSLLVRRSVVDEIGSWDEVRVSGDAEFRSRIMKAYGDESVQAIKSPMILSFALVRSDSLTQSGPTSIRTLKYGLRAQYRDAYANWHREGEGNPTLLKMSRDHRPYVVPIGVCIDRDVQRHYDLVVVCDFALKGGAFGSTLNYILAARQAGLSVAVYHWRKYELRADTILNPRLYQACLDYGVDILTVGDSVSAETILIGYPAILQHLPDALPEVKTDRVLVMVNQYASRLVDGSDRQYDPAVARANLKTLFGQEGLWIPISNWVKRLMSEDPAYTTPYPEPWHPMIRTEDWFHRPIRWNGDVREHPIVGRHSRDSYTKWPAEVEAIRQAYGADQPWEVRLLGGAAHPISLLGYRPDNWSVYSFDSVEVSEFLADLDFFIHYPHEDYIEEFGRAVLEAMAAGKPVILPPQFQDTFGSSALYATPENVSTIMNDLWKDKEAYISRAEIGREFATLNSDHSTFLGRYRKVTRDFTSFQLLDS